MAADVITLSNYDYTFKVLLLGDACIGKTSFTKRYCYNIFNLSERLTIGVDFHVKTIDLHGKKIKFQIWDIGDEERFRFLLPTYCFGANAALLVYDVFNLHGLDNVSDWAKIVRQQAGNIPIGMVGMRVDEEKIRVISREYAINMAKTLDLDLYGEISAKTGQNVEKMFQVLTDITVEKLEKFGMLNAVERFNVNPSQNTLKRRLYEFLQKLKRLYFK